MDGHEQSRSSDHPAATTPASSSLGNSKRSAQKSSPSLFQKVQRRSAAKVVPLNADGQDGTGNTDQENVRRKKKKPPPAPGMREAKKVPLAEEVHALAAIIRENNTPTVECSALFDRFGPRGARIVADALASIPDGHCTITQLTLDGNWITDEGAAHFAGQLGRVPHLKVLELRDNKLNDDGVRMICRALQNSTAPLERLSFSANAIGTRGCIAIAELVRHMPTLGHILLLKCQHMSLPSLGCFARLIMEMELPPDRPLPFLEGLEWVKLCEPMHFKKQFEFDAEVLSYLKDMRQERNTRERERLLRLESSLQAKWHVQEIDKAELMLQDAIHTKSEETVREAVNRARGMDCPEDAPWMIKAVAFIRECVAARKREIGERKRRRRWRRQEKARRERERAEREARELEEARERDKKPRGLLMFTLLFGFCCLLTACGLRPAFLNAKDRMTYVVARLNVACFSITFAFGVFILYLVTSGNDEFLRATAASVTNAATSATDVVAGAAGVNISTDVNANIDGKTFEPCTVEDVMPALHYYSTLAACQAGGLAVTQFLPFETPQSCEGNIVSTLLSSGDNCDDADADSICDVEDSCPGDALNDEDEDGICDLEDSCPNDKKNDGSNADGVCNGLCATLGGDLALAQNDLCDAANNINACGWDGGDCAAASCRTSWVNDNSCDVSTNTPECSWDGGDCCDPEIVKTSCLDPHGDRPCVAAWSEWTSCNVCGRNVFRTRTFSVAVASTGLGKCIHADGFVAEELCTGAYTPCDSDSDGIDDDSDPCTCNNSTGACPPDSENPDIDSDGLCDVGFDPCIDGVWLAPQLSTMRYVALKPNDEDADGVCDSVDSCPEDALNDQNDDGICDEEGLFNVARVDECMPVSKCPGPLQPYCSEVSDSNSGELYMRLSCSDVCLRNSVVQRSCNDSNFSVATPLLPIANAYIGIPGVVNYCAETAPGSGVWINSTCEDYVPGLGLFADRNCSVPLNASADLVGGASADFRDWEVVDGLRVVTPDKLAGACAGTDSADPLAEPLGAPIEHTCFVQTSLDETVTFIIIGVVAAIAVMVLAFVVKNIVDRKKYQPEEYEEEIISDSSEEEEEAEPDEFDVDEFGRTKEEAAVAANDDESGAIETKHGGDGSPALVQHDASRSTTPHAGGTAHEEEKEEEDPAAQKHPDHVAVSVAAASAHADDPASTKSPEQTKTTDEVESTIVGQEQSGKL